MSLDHNRIKVADLEKGEPNKILITNSAGELTFSDMDNPSLQAVTDVGSITSNGVTVGQIIVPDVLQPPSNLNAVQIATSPPYDYLAQGYTHSYRVYAYKIVDLIKIYSKTYSSFDFLDDGSENFYDVLVSWTASSGADGYKVMKYTDLGLGLNYDFSRNVVTTSFIDDRNTQYNQDVVVLPNYVSPVNSISGTLSLPNETASTIASFDASKNVKSLSTATYPSLTELSYGKGVTSAIQTQLNGKQNSLGFSPENVANKSSSFTASSPTTYPNTKALVDGLATKQNTITNPVTGTGTGFRIPFWGTSSSLSSDESAFIWDNTNKRIGLGTSSPDGSFHVLGASYLSLVIERTGDKVGKYLLGISNSNNCFAITDLAQSGAIRLYIAASGNVGLGTISPSEKLNVNGYSLATGYKTPSGLSTEFLKADGSVDSKTYLDSLTGALDTTVVHKTGNESVGGIKTFTSSPLIDNGSLNFSDTDLQGDIMTIYANSNKWQFSNTFGGKLLDFNNSAISFYKTNAIKADILSGSLTASQSYTLPNATGTLALTSDIVNYTSAINAKEPTIIAGTTNQYYRGDKTFQTLDKTAVGLGNVANTSDSSKPVSTAQQAALDLKANIANPTFTGVLTGASGTFSSLVHANNGFNFVGTAIQLADATRITWSADGTAGSAKDISINRVNSGGVISLAITDGNGLTVTDARLKDLRAKSYYVANGTSSQFLKGNGTVDTTVYAPINSPTLTGTPQAPTALADTNSQQIATTAFVANIARPYKVYTALLTQSSTSAPTAKVLENTLGGTIAWTRFNTGQYIGTLTSAFTADKTWSVMGAVNNSERIKYASQRNGNANQFLVVSYYDTTNTDSLLTDTPIEIRVYN